MRADRARDRAHARRRGRRGRSRDRRSTSWAFDSRGARRRARASSRCAGDRDGHDFVADAFAAGRTRRARRTRRVGLERVTPRRRARAGRRRHCAGCRRVARSVRAARADLRVVGVTGSTGKTSTKDLLAAALAPLGLSREPGVVQQRVRPAAHAAATRRRRRGSSSPRWGSGSPATSRCCATSRGPQIGVVTNVGLAHAEHLGGREGVAAVLGELLDALPAGRRRGAERRRRVDAAARGRRRGARRDRRHCRPTPTIAIADVELDDALRAVVHARRTPVRASPLRGAHQVHERRDGARSSRTGRSASPFDEIAARLAARATGALAHGAARDRRRRHRAQRRVQREPDVDGGGAARARAPAASRVGGSPCSATCASSGAHSDDAHAAVGVRAAELGLDVSSASGAGGAVIADAAADARRSRSHVVDDAAAAPRWSTRSSRPGDAVLVKASRAVGLEVVADGCSRRRGSRADAGGGAA